MNDRSGFRDWMRPAPVGAGAGLGSFCPEGDEDAALADASAAMAFWMSESSWEEGSGVPASPCCPQATLPTKNPTKKTSNNNPCHFMFELHFQIFQRRTD